MRTDRDPQRLSCSTVLNKRWNPYAFRVTIVTPVAAPHFLKVVQEKFHPERVAIIYDIT